MPGAALRCRRAPVAQWIEQRFYSRKRRFTRVFKRFHAVARALSTAAAEAGAERVPPVSCATSESSAGKALAILDEQYFFINIPRLTPLQRAVPQQLVRNRLVADGVAPHHWVVIVS